LCGAQNGSSRNYKSQILIFAKQFLRPRQSVAHGTSRACHGIDTPLTQSTRSESREALEQWWTNFSERGRQRAALYKIGWCAQDITTVSIKTNTTVDFF